MKRKALNLATVVSAALCAAVVVLWVRSYEPKTSAVMLLAGQWDVEHWRGQVWVIRHPPNPDPSFVRTTVHMGLTGPHPAALVKALVFKRDAPWDEKHGMPSELLSRPYLLVNLDDGVRLDNAGGFAATTARFPESLRLRVPELKQYGSILQAVAVPHWFLFAVTAAAPGAWLLRRAAARRARVRTRTGLCPDCGYDLRASPGRCPECGAGAVCQIGSGAGGQRA